jgi:hypothetical protein
MPEYGEITFERRRYGRKTFTWAYLWVDKETPEQLGDPAPSLTFPKADLDEELERKLKELPLDPTADDRYSRPIKIF